MGRSSKARTLVWSFPVELDPGGGPGVQAQLTEAQCPLLFFGQKHANLPGGIQSTREQAGRMTGQSQSLRREGSLSCSRGTGGLGPPR